VYHTCALSIHSAHQIAVPAAPAGLDDAGLCGKQKVVAAALAANAQLLQQGRGEQQAQQQDQKQHAFRVLQALGGLEIAAMVGAYVHAAQHSVPVIVDGFISGAAALVALAMEPAFVGRALLLSHMSAEKGTQVLTTALSAGLQGCGAGTSGSSTAGSTAQQGDGEVSESAAEAAQAGQQQQQQQQQEEQGVVMIPQPVLDMDLRLGEGTGAVMCLPLLRSAAAIACNMASLADVMAAQ
jgi:NaMN:DMB phosphoribosyltransferase